MQLILQIFLLVLFSKFSSIRAAKKNVNDTIVEVFNNCLCVEYYQCDGDNFIITTGETLINVRLNAPRIFCSGTKVCCYLRPKNGTIITKEPVITTIVDPTTDPTTGPTTGSTIGPTTDPTTFKEKKIKKCGVQIPNLDLRIIAENVDASTSLTGEFPWIATILKQNPSTKQYKFKCFGSLIHPQVILTVTHCVKRADLNDFKIIVNGENELKLEGNSPADESTISEIVKHPDYYSGGLHNDIALIFLQKPYNISNFTSPINTICMPSKTQNFDNLKCIVVGWGKDSKILKKVDVPIVARSKCEQLLKRTRLGPGFELHSSFICAGGEKGRDACEGDGGSPLMCQVENRYYQAGMVSWGIECAKANVPGVYTDVSQFRGWIDGEVAKKSFVFKNEIEY